MSLIAPITNISRGSLHDGAGVRTVVYLKGCGLRCRWCHNPETLSAPPHLIYLPSKCICCGRCVERCPEHHVVVDGRMQLLREGCRVCGKCVEVCPSGALSTVGEMRSDEEVFEEIKKDIHYYKSSNGGVTFSGGECLLHPDFVASVAGMCRQEGISVAVETALFVPWENIERVLPQVDFFFADLKHPDPDRHAEYTGKDNRLIVENLRRLSSDATELAVRIPVIPGVNDSEKDFDGFAEIIRSLGDRLAYVELLKYNNLAESKYTIIGEKYESFANSPQSDAEMTRLCRYLSDACGVECRF